MQPCKQEADIAVLKEMARRNEQCHFEMKADLKSLIAWKWQMIGGGIAAASIISTGISLAISIVLGAK